MNSKNVTALKDSIAKALAAQVQRVFNVARIKGWAFPDDRNVAVAVRVIAATPLVTKVMARIDEIVIAQGDVTQARALEDINKMADSLVAAWLDKHATARPKRAG